MAESRFFNSYKTIFLFSALYLKDKKREIQNNKDYYKRCQIESFFQTIEGKGENDVRNQGKETLFINIQIKVNGIILPYVQTGFYLLVGFLCLNIPPFLVRNYILIY